MSEGIKLIARNRHAYHQYSVLDKLEAGIALQGSEVKSIRMNSAISLKEAYVDFNQGEAWLVGARISPYAQANMNNHEPERRRKLLLRKRQIHVLERKVQEKGLTVAPLSVYFKHGRVKLEIGLCRGKHLHDKRETIKQRESDREMQRALKRHV